MRWIVGDIHGSLSAFDRLLAEIGFDPARDELWSLGDVIDETERSFDVLARLSDVGGKAIMGNWELGLLASASGRRRSTRLHSLTGHRRFAAFHAQLRDLPVLVHLPAQGAGPAAWLVHGGLAPSWHDLPRVAASLNACPRDDAWVDRADVRFATTVRCCDAEGTPSPLKGPPSDCEPPFRPWYAFYGGDTLVIHGHWAWHGFHRTGAVMGLDSGCRYGGALTAWCQDEDRIVRVPCGPA